MFAEAAAKRKQYKLDFRCYNSSLNVITLTRIAVFFLNIIIDKVNKVCIVRVHYCAGVRLYCWFGDIWNASEVNVLGEIAELNQAIELN